MRLTGRSGRAAAANPACWLTGSPACAPHLLPRPGAGTAAPSPTACAVPCTSPPTASAGCCAAARVTGAASAATGSSGTTAALSGPSASIRTNFRPPRVPAACRWHVSSGVAYPGGDDSSWCRLPHAAVCPARDTPPTPPELTGLRRSLAVNTRRLIDAGAFTPPPASPDNPAPQRKNPAACRPARPVVQLLYVRYLAARPVDEIQCIAQTRRRHRCTSTLLSPDAPAGTWKLVPATVTSGQLALPAAVMAIYDLSAIPYAEQLRWRAQRCLQHAASPTAADLAVADWEPFDPLRHHEQPPSRPHPTPRPHRQGTRGSWPMTPFHALELTLPRPATQGELRHARASVRPTANAARTRLMAVQSAQPGRCPARAAAPTGHATADRRPDHALPQPERPGSAQHRYRSLEPLRPPTGPQQPWAAASGCARPVRGRGPCPA